MPKARIALLGPAYPYRGGNALFMGHLYEKLSESYEVTMINYKLLYPSLLFPGSSQFDKSKDTITPIPSLRKINSIGPISWINTAQFLNKEKFDLVCFDWYNPFFAPALGSIARLLSNHYTNKKLFITENVISHEARSIDKILTSYALNQADAFLTLSDKVIQQLEPWRSNKKIYRSELPVYDCYDMPSADSDTQAFVQETGFDPAKHEILLFFGYIRAYKGLDLLIDAMPEIVKKRPHARLLVVGESYEDIRQYENQVSELGMTEFVKIVHRFVPNEEVGRYFVPSTLVVLPYRSATQSGILNIAYGFSKPVVITPVGGLHEFLDPDKTGVITREASPAALVEGIERFFALRETVNFTEFIKKRVEGNGFNQISTVFKEIIG